VDRDCRSGVEYYSPSFRRDQEIVFSLSYM
jgi:hypothetical protein